MSFKMRHIILVYDKTGKNLLAKFSPGSNTDQTSFYRNLKYDYREGVANIAFEVRMNDPKSEFIQEGNWVEIWRLGEPVRRGMIKPLTPSKDVKWLQVNALGDGIQLKNFTVPVEWEWWDKWELADIFRALLWAMEWKVWSWGHDWVKCTMSNTEPFSLLDGDENVKSEDIVLKKNANGAFLAAGTIISDVLGRYGNSEWYVFQVQDSVGEDTSIKYYVRSGPSLVPDHQWSPWTELPRSTSKTKAWSVAGQTGQYIQWKAELSTEDTESESAEGIYGKTPVIYAARMVSRYPIPNIEAGMIPASFGIQALDFKPSNETYIEVIKKLCEKYKVRYWFDCDWATRNSRVFLATNPGMDRSTEPGCIFRERRDFKNIEVQIDRNDYCNYLHLYGAGDGMDQLYDFLKDDAEITARGTVYGKFEDSECTDLTKLRAKGQEEFDKRLKGKYAIEMRVPGLRFTGKGNFPFSLFDWVYINAPSQKIDFKHQMIEMAVLETNRGESIGFRLDNHMLSTALLLEQMVNKVNLGSYDSGNGLSPNPPLNVFAKGEYKYISLQCVGNGTEYEWHYSKNGVDFQHLTTVSTRYTEHKVSTGVKRWYKVRQLVKGAWSPFSNVVSATSTTIPPKDIYLPQPIKPIAPIVQFKHFKQDPNIQSIGNLVKWTPPDTELGITTVTIERTEGTNKAYFTAPAASGEYYDSSIQPGKEYSYAVQHVPQYGVPSEFSPASQSGTTPTATTTPSTPTGLTASAVLRNIILGCNPVPDYGTAGYEWRYSEGSDPVTATPLLGNKNSNKFIGDYGHTYNVWVRAYTVVNGSNYYSDWKGPVAVTCDKATKEDIIGIHANQITGQLTDSQITSISTSKLTGKVADNQIDTVSASQITGKLTSDQIANLDGGKVSGTIKSLSGVPLLDIDESMILNLKDATGYQIADEYGYSRKVITRDIFVTTDPGFAGWADIEVKKIITVPPGKRWYLFLHPLGRFYAAANDGNTDHYIYYYRQDFYGAFMRRDESTPRLTLGPGTHHVEKLQLNCLIQVYFRDSSSSTTYSKTAYPAAFYWEIIEDMDYIDDINSSIPGVPY